MVGRQRALGTKPSLLLLDALTFVVAQAVRLPILWLLTRWSVDAQIPASLVAWVPTLNIALLCFTSGLFEEGARYIGYRFALPRARRREEGVTYGLGHGGGEAIILGAAVAWTFFTMLSLKGVDASALPAGLDEPTKTRIVMQARSYWSMPFYLPLLGGLERLLAMCFHVAMALLVLGAVTRGRVGLLLLAMALHAIANAAAVVTSRALGPLAAEVLLTVVAGACLWMSVRARPRRAAFAGRECRNAPCLTRRPQRRSWQPHHLRHRHPRPRGALPPPHRDDDGPRARVPARSSRGDLSRPR
jgi:uncharacterized membrane protein YhfC